MNKVTFVCEDNYIYFTVLCMSCVCICMYWFRVWVYDSVCMHFIAETES